MDLAGVVRRLTKHMGSNVNVFKKGSETTIPDFTALALKNTKENTKNVVFQFPDSCDIEVGDVLIQNGTRDRWVATEIEDKVIKNKYSHLEVSVEKEGAKLKTQAATSSVVYNLHGPNARVNQNSIDQSSNVHIVDNSSLGPLVAELRREINNLELDETTQAEALQVVDVIQSQTTTDKPNKTILSSMVAGLINLLPHAANVATVGSAILENLPK